MKPDKPILTSLRERILLLDGAMGTMLRRHGLSGNPDRFNRVAPDTVAAVHRAYIEAGADIIETNTFCSNRISQQEFGLAEEAAAFAREGARLARAEADRATRPVWVAGSVGPTSKSLTLSTDITDSAARAITFEALAAVYREQIEALIEGGVDLLLIETCFDALNAKAALQAVCRTAADFPVIVSVSPGDRAGRTLAGQTLEAFYTAVRHYPLTAFGLNCSPGAEAMFPLIERVSRFCEFPLICYPSAGLPDEQGAYGHTPQMMAAAIHTMAAAGLVNIVGACCGSTPEHIAAVKAALTGLAPRTFPAGDMQPFLTLPK